MLEFCLTGQTLIAWPCNFHSNSRCIPDVSRETTLNRLYDHLSKINPDEDNVDITNGTSKPHESHISKSLPLNSSLASLLSYIA